MPVEKYMAKFSSGSFYRNRDNAVITPELMVEVHEGTDGSVRAYAVPSPTRLGDDVSIVELDDPSTLQQAGHNVVTARNEELVVRNAALEHINNKLEEQNRELMDRLMRITDTVMEKLYGEEQAAGGSRSRPASKKPRAAKAAEGSNGAET
jgi:hypothetical protein